MIVNEGGGGKPLPTLTNPGAAGDMLSGKQLINQEGEIVTGTIPSKSDANLSVSGRTVTVPAGYYAKQASKSIASVTQATPSISVNANGLITAVAQQSAGYVEAGSKSATHQLTTQGGKTVTPSTAQQTAVASGRYTTGAVYVAGSANLIPANIKQGVNIFGVVGTLEGKNTETATVNIRTTSTGIYISYQTAGLTDYATAILNERDTTLTVGLYGWIYAYDDTGVVKITANSGCLNVGPTDGRGRNSCVQITSTSASINVNVV